MKTTFGLRIALAFLVGLPLAHGQQAEAPSKPATLQADILPFKNWKENEEPVMTNTFLMGDVAVFITRIAGFGLKPDGRTPSIDASFTIRAPDGESIPLGEIRFKAQPLEEEGQTRTILQPILPIEFSHERFSTGCYSIDVALTDTVTRATAKAHLPVFVFLTPGSRDLISAPRPDAPVALDNTLLSPGFWDMPKDEIAAAFWAIGLRWTSVDQTAMSSIAKKATFQGRPVADVKIQFEGNTPSEVKLILYNRGDEGMVSEEVFNATSKSVIDEMTRWTKAKPQDMTPKSGTSSAQKIAILTWKGETHFLRLEQATSNVREEGMRGKLFQPEYIALSLLPVAQRTQTEMAGRDRDLISSYALIQRVVKDPNGDVYLDVPMHDQGERGIARRPPRSEFWTSTGRRSISTKSPSGSRWAPRARPTRE